MTLVRRPLELALASSVILSAPHLLLLAQDYWKRRAKIASTALMVWLLKIRNDIHPCRQVKLYSCLRTQEWWSFQFEGVSDFECPFRARGKEPFLDVLLCLTLKQWMARL